MVGCSVPYCSNRTDKGFKTYRLPHDPRRRQQWIRFAGRSNWNPGSGASFCQVHFEETAFESHRADGLRKLKPNAIPTIHSLSTSSRKQRKQNVKPRVEFTSGESGSESLILVEKMASKSNDGDQIQIAEVYCSQLDDTQMQPSRRKKLKTIHVTEIINNRVQEEFSENEELIESIKVYRAIEDAKNHTKDSTKKEAKVLPLVKAKRGRPLKKRRGGDVVNCYSNNSSTSVGNQSYGTEEEEMDQVINRPYSSERIVEEIVVKCFVCNQVITPGYAVRLNIPTEATRILLSRRLEIIADLEGMISPQEVVCSRCASLLNHVDRTEAELTILKGAISACARGRNLDGRVEKDPEFANNVQLLDRFESIAGGRHNILSLDELFFIKTEKEDMAEKNINDGFDAEVRLDDGEVEEVFLMPDVKAELGRNNQEGEIDEGAEVSPIIEEPEVIALNVCEPSNELEPTEHNLKSMDKPRSKDKGTVKIKKGAESDITVKEALSTIRGESSTPEGVTQSKVHVCKICAFKTSHDCVMIWHLRMHMKDSRWCDFCNAAIPKQESIFSRLKKCRTPHKAHKKKLDARPQKPIILPAAPVDPLALPAFPLSSYPLALIPIQSGSASAPVLLISKELDDMQDPENLEMTAVVDMGISDNVCFSRTSVLPNEVVLSEEHTEKSAIKVEQEQKQSPVEDISPAEVFCRVEDVESVTTLGEAFGVSIGDCDNLVGGGVMQSFSSLPEQNSIVANESVHGNSGFADEGSQGSKTDNLHGEEVFCDDGVESSFLDTLSSQQEAKFAEILPEICDEVAERNVMTISNDTSEGNITNKDVSFARADGLGESELAIAYENSVAALMCQSDDSDGMLSYH